VVEAFTIVNRVVCRTDLIKYVLARTPAPMRYKSLVNVRYVLIDARNDLKEMMPTVSRYIGMHAELDCHILVLCHSASDAMRVERLGEESGSGCYCHGEHCPDENDAEKLLGAAWLVVRKESKHQRRRRWSLSSNLVMLLSRPEKLGSVESKPARTKSFFFRRQSDTINQPTLLAGAVHPTSDVSTPVATKDNIDDTNRRGSGWSG